MAKGKKTGGGSRKGSPNVATQDVRAAIATFAERNVVHLESWLQRVAEVDPAKAADIYLKAIEYHIPKLGRTELTGANGEPLAVNVMRFGTGEGNQTGRPPAIPKFK